MSDVSSLRLNHSTSRWTFCDDDGASLVISVDQVYTLGDNSVTWQAYRVDLHLHDSPIGHGGTARAALEDLLCSERAAFIDAVIDALPTR